jgi:hypothetical protein
MGNRFIGAFFPCIALVLLLKVKWKNCHASKVKAGRRVHPTSSSSFTLLSKDVYSTNLVVSYVFCLAHSFVVEFAGRTCQMERSITPLVLT